MARDLGSAADIVGLDLGSAADMLSASIPAAAPRSRATGSVVDMFVSHDPRGVARNLGSAADIVGLDLGSAADMFVNAVVARAHADAWARLRDGLSANPDDARLQSIGVPRRSTALTLHAGLRRALAA